MTNVDKIVNRFLGWKLPKDFAPDGGISFKRESDFGRSVYEPVGTHLFTTDQAKAMFEYCLQGLAEPVKQEPVAHYKDAPHTIYLQTGCDDPEDCECSFNEWGDTTWCVDQIHDTDIPYIRADYAAPVSAEAIRAEAFKEAAEWCKAKQSYSAMHANTEFAAGIRGLK